ncbi:MAG: class I SAM-dependent methyltransferase [Actinomycetota bacterium]|nr:class I SAM-dependent methyltransferase [Actinomycetota bacterium]
MTEPVVLDGRLRAVIERTRGFMPDAEGHALRGAAARAGAGVWLEIGTYCGKSTLYLADAARACAADLVTIDHHHGSEENQPGWEWHDPDLVDEGTGRIDTLPFLRHALHDADLEASVNVLVSSTQRVARWWASPLRFLFLDGNHTEPVAQHDYAEFAKHLVTDGILAIHDVFEDPRDGGRPPWNVYQRALRFGAFETVTEQGSLRVLRRTAVPID